MRVAFLFLLTNMGSLEIPPFTLNATLSFVSTPVTPETTKISSWNEVCDLGHTISEQEHIYAQLMPKGRCHLANNEILKNSPFSKTKDETVYPDPFSLRITGQALCPWNSVPDVRTPDQPSLASGDVNNYGFLVSPSHEKPKYVLRDDSAVEDDPAVCSISGRRVVVANGFKGGSENNNNQKAQIPSPPCNIIIRKEIRMERSTEDVNRTEMRRRRLQFLSDCFSLCLFVPGTILCILSPWLLVPIYIIPQYIGGYLPTLIWICCIGSAVFVFVGCLVGNMVWYRAAGKWKCLLHCGKGPKGHYWGNSITRHNPTQTV